MRAKLTRFGTTHHMAVCRHPDCEWNDALGGDRSVAAVTAAAKRHCEKLGHVVDIETGASSTYEPIGSAP